MSLVLIGLIIIAILVVPLIFQILWNMTVPEVFGLAGLRYWQAFRLLLLASMIFGAGGLVRFSLNR